VDERVHVVAERAGSDGLIEVANEVSRVPRPRQVGQQLGNSRRLDRKTRGGGQI
jgi:hypothetical protein